MARRRRHQILGDVAEYEHTMALVTDHKVAPVEQETLDESTVPAEVLAAARLSEETYLPVLKAFAAVAEDRIHLQKQYERVMALRHQERTQQPSHKVPLTERLATTRDKRFVSRC
jgi:hypothetical protein